MFLAIRHTGTMRSRILCFFLCACCLSPFPVGCGTSRHHMEMDAALNAYKYIVFDEAGDDLLLSMELEQMFAGLGFELATPYRVRAMPVREQSTVLGVKVRVLTDEWSARAQVRLFDLASGRIVYRGEGEYGGGLLEPRDQALAAVRRALEGVFENYEGYSPEARREKDDFWGGEWETISRSRDELERYYDEHRGTLDPVEGIWSSWDDSTKVAVFSSYVPGKRDYVGIVLSSDMPAWGKGQVLLKLRKTAHSNAYTGKMAWGDKSWSGGTFVIDDNGVLGFDSYDPHTARRVEYAFLRTYPLEFDPDGEHPMVSGSGFLLDESGLVVTNNHVIEDKGVIKVRFASLEKMVRARLVVHDVHNDLAILRLENAEDILSVLGTPPFGFGGPGEVRVGQEVITAGFPLPGAMGGNCKLTTGVISGLSGTDDQPNNMQMTNPIQPGNSGGAVVNRQGNVVGVVVSSLSDKYFYNRVGVIPQNVNYCVKLEYLRALATMVPEANRAMRRRADLSGLRLEQLFDRIAPFMVQIRIYPEKKGMTPKSTGSDTRGGTNNRGTPGRIDVRRRDGQEMGRGNARGADYEIFRRPPRKAQETTGQRRVGVMADEPQRFTDRPAASSTYPVQGGSLRAPSLF